MDIDIRKKSNGIKIGIMTSGGDSQGMNAAVRAAVRSGIYFGAEPYMIREGYYGLLNPVNNIIKGEWDNVPPMALGGTAIGSARCKDMYELSGRLKAVETLIKYDIHSLIIIGGDGSLTGGELLRSTWNELLVELEKQGRITKDDMEKHPHLSICGLIGSIDNDMCGTDYTIGAMTSLQRILDAIDAISTSAESHKRAFVIEVMGRNCGWLALMTAISAEADYLFIPEKPQKAEKWKCDLRESMLIPRKKGKRLSIVIISEGAIDDLGKPIKTKEVTEILVSLGLDTRATVLGHVQRGGTPSAFDRILGSSQGIYAVKELIEIEKSNKDSIIIAIQKNKICGIKLTEAVEITKNVSKYSKNQNFDEVFKLRGPLFKDTYNIAHNMIAHAVGSVEKKPESRTLAVVNVGAPACGNNSFFHTIVRESIRRGDRVVAIYGGFTGLFEDDSNVLELTWLDVDGWVARAGSEIGASRCVPTEADIPKIAAFFQKYDISGFIIVGGYEALRSVKVLSEFSKSNPSIAIPTLCVPSTLSNNVPGTTYSIGADTALNTAVSFADTLRRSASSTRRVFIIQLQGGNCGYLVTMAGVAAGAAFSYTPENGLSLDDVKKACEYMHHRFNGNKKNGRIILVSDKCTDVYSTDVISKVLTSEGHGIYDSRYCVPGHLLQGSLPTPYDRVLGARYANATVDLLDQMISQKQLVYGLVSQSLSDNMEVILIDDLVHRMDDNMRRDKLPWWHYYKSLSNILSGLNLSDDSDDSHFNFTINPVTQNI